ncbi:hypothetical protein CYMTET_28439 [Cymbomonas tetramitiformis]|uniref:TRP C-terminal domain-containing protein n=1 Tax=Cymbomonas tetramitiformis TaxID=36881 RepID=A0AAE0FMY9_9CHLO|nr:hypothetical protein CYMTET_28439 [Cymbomonas tetramitiformis]
MPRAPPEDPTPSEREVASSSEDSTVKLRSMTMRDSLTPLELDPDELHDSLNPAYQMAAKQNVDVLAACGGKPESRILGSEGRGNSRDCSAVAKEEGRFSKVRMKMLPQGETSRREWTGSGGRADQATNGNAGAATAGAVCEGVMEEEGRYVALRTLHTQMLPERQPDREMIRAEAHAQESMHHTEMKRVSAEAYARRVSQLSTFQAANGILHPQVSIAFFLLILLHPTISTCMLQVFNCDQMYFKEVDREFFLHMDRSRKCFSPEWWLCAVVASFIICVYVLGLPIGYCVLSYDLYDRKKVIILDGSEKYVRMRMLHAEKALDRERGLKKLRTIGRTAEQEEHVFWMDTQDGERVKVFPVFIEGAHHRNPLLNIESKLMHPQVYGALGPFIIPYTDKHYYWTHYDLLRRMVTTSLVILVQMFEDQPGTDMVYISITSTFALLIHCYAQPYKSKLVNWLTMLILFSQSLMILGMIAFQYLLGLPSTSASVYGYFLVIVQGILACSISYFIAKDLYPLFCGYLLIAYKVADAGASTIVERREKRRKKANDDIGPRGSPGLVII